jgi:AAA family ATP:ADP antiporter
VQRLVYRLCKVEPAEFAALLWSFAYFFCLLCGYYVLRPVRDEMGIQGGIQNLPWLFTATFLAMLAAVPLYGFIAARYARRAMLPIVYLFFAANLLLFYLLMAASIAPGWVARAFFVWLSVFNLFVVSVFWSFMADLFSNEQAKRLFGFVAAGGSAGALAGPTLTASLVHVLGVANLLPISILFLLGAVVCIHVLSRWSHERTPAREAAAHRPLGGSVWAGLRLAFSSPYLLAICGYILVLTMTSTLVYLEQANIVATALASSIERTRLFASIDLTVNMLTLFTQLFLTNRILSGCGVRCALLAMPVLSVLGFAAMGVAPTLAVLVVFIVLRRALEYAVSKPAREVLFTVLTREEKYKAKNVVDTVVTRGGDAASGWLVTGLRELGAGTAHLAFLALPLSLLWAALSLFLARRHARLATESDRSTRT